VDIHFLVVFRYAINDVSMDWDSAQSQVDKLVKGDRSIHTVVSVKKTAEAPLKRKADFMAPSESDKTKKPNRRSKKIKR
jgi:hypothetical protein